ncbi:uncharacterized protein VP01_1841g9 [Puccinia sorghi]|uniref:Uncharacterized protein n=1 Tax=Puccinia sorghi TaxID=27349 RepID=A0A0L6VDP2_9BASI|nr:uncharacterized protein VP01_1841g9 [Puccinia sorghi]
MDRPVTQSGIELGEIDIFFQIGYVHEKKGIFNQAKDAYKCVSLENTTHAKVPQQLGGLHIVAKGVTSNPQEAAHILTRSLSKSCNNLIPDAIDAYERTIYLDSNNVHIHRHQEIRLHANTGAQFGPPPSPRDMNHYFPNWPFPNTLSGSAAAGFGHLAYNRTHNTCRAFRLCQQHNPARHFN